MTRLFFCLLIVPLLGADAPELRRLINFPKQRLITGDCTPISKVIVGQTVAYQQWGDTGQFSSAYIHRRAFEVAGLTVKSPLLGVNQVLTSEAGRIYGFVRPDAYRDWLIVFPPIPTTIESDVVYRCEWRYLGSYDEALRLIDAGGAAVLDLDVPLLSTPAVYDRKPSSGARHAVAVVGRGKMFDAGGKVYLSTVNPWGAHADAEITPAYLDTLLSTGSLLTGITEMVPVVTARR